MLVGYEAINGGGQNPVPALWEKIFQEDLFDKIAVEQSILDLYIGWMGEYLKDKDTFTYITGLLMPIGYSIPENFSYRRITSCQIGLGTINGSFKDEEVFEQAHNMTVKSIYEMGYMPDYSFGWSAEAYPKDLSFDAKNGTINYICPCKKEISR